MPQTYETDYQGPPRDPEDVIRAAFSNPDLMRGLVISYEAELRGEKPVPLKDLETKPRIRRSA